MDTVSVDILHSLGQLVADYGIFALIPVLMLEGSIMAIGIGVLAGANVISFWQAVLVILIADILMTHVFYIAGLETTVLFNWIRDKFEIKSSRNSKLRQLRLWTAKRLKERFGLTYTMAKFIPLPYTTITATILSGALGIKYKRIISLLLILAPLQAIIYTSFGYFSVQGVFYELTVWRVLGLILVVVLGMLIFAARHQLMYILSNQSDSN